MKNIDKTKPDPLDQTLDYYRTNPAGDDLRNRILTAAHTQAQKPPPWSQSIKELLGALGGWPVAGPALAFSMLLGVATDLVTRPSTTANNLLETETETTTIWELALLSTDSQSTDEYLQ